MNSENREILVADGLATVDQAAKFLSVGRSTVYSLMNSGQLAHAKIGRSSRIPWKAVHQLAADALRNGDEEQEESEKTK